MAWGAVNVSEKRLEFVIRAARGQESMRALCREYGISPETGYKWLKRYQQTGKLADVKEHSRRPAHSPSKTPSEVERRVVALRRQWPDWGAKKLRIRLAEEGIELPVITVHRILLRHQLVPEQARRRPARHRFERERPNELWQMDYKGVPPQVAAHLLPLGIIDDHSRYLTALAALPNTGAEPLLGLLPRIFADHGVPEAMLLDHGTPWWNARSAWGLTRVSLWLMKQDIEIIHSGIRHPQTQGKIESCNGSIERRLLWRGRPERIEDWPEWLVQFRNEWNHIRPHEALQMATPASRWHPSGRAYRAEPRAFDYPAGASVRRIAAHGQLRFENRFFSGPAALAGEYVAIQHFREDRYVVSYRRTLIREIDVSSGQSWPLPFQPYRDLFSWGDAEDEAEDLDACGGIVL